MPRPAEPCSTEPYPAAPSLTKYFQCICLVLLTFKCPVRTCGSLWMPLVSDRVHRLNVESTIGPRFRRPPIPEAHPLSANCQPIFKLHGIDQLLVAINDEGAGPVLEHRPGPQNPVPFHHYCNREGRRLAQFLCRCPVPGPVIFERTFDDDLPFPDLGALSGASWLLILCKSGVLRQGSQALLSGRARASFGIQVRRGALSSVMVRLLPLFFAISAISSFAGLLMSSPAAPWFWIIGETPRMGDSILHRDKTSSKSCRKSLRDPPYRTCLRREVAMI